MSIYRRSYTDENGKRRSTTTFYVEFRDHAGRRQRVPAFTDRASSRKLRDRLVELSALRASGQTPDEPMRRWVEGLAPDLRDRLAEIGLITAKQVAGLRPLADLLASWKTSLEAANVSPHHVQVTTTAAARVFDGVGAKHWTELDADAVANFLKAEREKKVKPIGARTSNSLLAAARQFCRWAVKKGLAVEDPLRSLEMLNVAEDRRKERRALTPDELRKLVETTAGGPVRNGMTGAERSLLYRVASETGLRRGEIVALTVADLDVVDENDASVRAQAKTTKNRREARLPLRAPIARDLREFVRLRMPSAPVFTPPKKWEAAKTLEADLAAAGIARKDDVGREVDFHALRTTFGTNLARGRVSLAMAQRLMRHSTPTLTANVYTVLSRDDERNAVAALPETAPPARDAAQATGTEDGSHWRVHWRADPSLSGSERDSAGLGDAAKSETPTALEPAEMLAFEAPGSGDPTQVPVVGRVGIEPTTSTL